MRRTLNYHTSTNIWLSLEDYHNAGLTSEQTKDIIEKVTDWNGIRFYCTPSGLNGNWIINTCSNDPGDIQSIVFRIMCALENALDEM